MKITLDPKKRIWMLVRLSGGLEHSVVSGPTTWDVCEAAYDRNRNKRGLFILTKGQVREFEGKWKLRRKKKDSSEFRVQSLELKDKSEKIRRNDFVSNSGSTVAQSEERLSRLTQEVAGSSPASRASIITPLIGKSPDSAEDVDEGLFYLSYFKGF